MTKRCTSKCRSSAARLAVIADVNLSPTYFTYVPAGGQPEAAPTLRLSGYQESGLLREFTTISFEPDHNGTVTPGVWQQWTIAPTSLVWQTNNNDGFCPQSARCALAQFIAQYPTGIWSRAHLGLGTGVAGPAVGLADALAISNGTQTLFTDFDPLVPPPPPPPPSASPTADAPALPATGAHPARLVVPATTMLVCGSILLLAARRMRKWPTR